MKELIEMLNKLGIKTGLETQGTIYQSWMELVDDVTVSPKPPSSLMKTDFEKLDKMIYSLQESNARTGCAVSLKVVVFDDKDFEYAKMIHKRYPDVEFFLSVGNADAKEEGKIASRLLEKLNWLWDKVINDPDMNNAKPLPQLHTLVYDNLRGV